MKLQTNFSFPFDKWLPACIGSGWVLAFLGFFLGLAMVFSSLRFTRESPALKKNLEQLLKNPVSRPSAAMMPSNTDLDELERHLKGLDALEVGGGKPVAALLSKLERLLPLDARLLSFQQEQRTGEIQLVVEASNMEDLSKLLSALEGDGGFAKVTLTKQSRSQAQNGSWVQFSIDLVENPT
jgi:hypothetical protein